MNINYTIDEEEAGATGRPTGVSMSSTSPWRDDDGISEARVRVSFTNAKMYTTPTPITYTPTQKTHNELVVAQSPPMNISNNPLPRFERRNPKLL